MNYNLRILDFKGETIAVMHCSRIYSIRIPSDTLPYCIYLYHTGYDGKESYIGSVYGRKGAVYVRWETSPSFAWPEKLR